MINAIKIPIGVNDRDGVPIYIGDTLEFDEAEFGSRCIFTITMKDGCIEHPGTTTDLTNWCRVLKRNQNDTM